MSYYPNLLYLGVQVMQIWILSSNIGGILYCPNIDFKYQVNEKKRPYKMSESISLLSSIIENSKSIFPIFCFLNISSTCM